MKHACFIAATAAVALLGFAAPASATHSDGITQCGETIETNNATVLLTSDVVCPGDSFSNGAAVTIDAENVTLNLGGHAIRSGASGGSVGIFGDRTDGSGIPLPYSNLTIRNGTIEGFIEGVSVLASNSTVAGLRVNPGVYPFANPAGIETRGNDNLSIGNTIVFGELSAAWHRDLLRWR